MVQVKFKTSGSNSAFGGFSPGDTLRTSEAMAKHLIDQGVADYMNAPAEAPAPVEPPAAPEKPAAKPRAKK